MPHRGCWRGGSREMRVTREDCQQGSLFKWLQESQQSQQLERKTQTKAILYLIILDAVFTVSQHQACESYMYMSHIICLVLICAPTLQPHGHFMTTINSPRPSDTVVWNNQTIEGTGKKREIKKTRKEDEKDIWSKSFFNMIYYYFSNAFYHKAGPFLAKRC